MDSVKQLQCTGESPITKNYLAQNVNSAGNETLPYRESDNSRSLSTQDLEKKAAVPSDPNPLNSIPEEKESQAGRLF